MNVIFSERAMTCILHDVCEWGNKETGGVLLGKKIDDIWYIIEVIDAGNNAIRTYNSIEFDNEYVTYYANYVSKLYEIELELLGLWHKHPGNDNDFSSEDIILNNKYADILPDGSLSVLLTMGDCLSIDIYYISKLYEYMKLTYQVSDYDIPKQYKKYKSYLL